MYNCSYWGSFMGAMAGALVGVGFSAVVITFLQGKMNGR